MATPVVTSRKEEKMSDLAYSLHLGSDKNRKNISKQNGKNNLSGTTSLPNNAIQNVRQLSKVDNTSKEYDKIQTLSNTLVNAHEQLKDKNNKIKTLSENNKALNLRVKTLNNTIKEKDNEISFLKYKIYDIQNTLNYWKDKFEKLILFLHSKLHSWYNKDDKYIDVVNDMYEDNVLDEDDIEILDLSKEKDDFER